MASSINNRFTPNPLPRTNTASDSPKSVAPPVSRTVAKPTVDFSVSSFEQGGARRGLNLLGGTAKDWQTPTPTPTPRQTPTQGASGVQQTGGTQGDGILQEGEYVSVTAPNGLNRREGPSTDALKFDTGFESGSTLKVVMPEDGPPVVRDGFVYVEGSNGDRGWVSTGFVQELPEAQAAVLRAHEAAIAPFREMYVDQVQAETQVRDANGKPGDGTSGNCGPSSLVVAFLQQGLILPTIPGLTGSATSDGAQVQAMRYAMYNGVDPTMDGVATNAQNQLVYDTAENSEFTTFEAMQKAVTDAHGTADMLNPPSTTNIQTAVEDGKTVIVSGTFEGKGDGEPWAHYDTTTEHVIAVVGTTPEGDFIVCDPAFPDSKPHVVTPEQLERFMEGNPGAMSVDGPSNTAG